MFFLHTTPDQCAVLTCVSVVLGSASVPEMDVMWQKLANNPQLLQYMFSLPYTNSVLEGLEANPGLAQQVELVDVSLESSLTTAAAIDL